MAQSFLVALRRSGGRFTQEAEPQAIWTSAMADGWPVKFAMSALVMLIAIIATLADVFRVIAARRRFIVLPVIPFPIGAFFWGGVTHGSVLSFRQCRF
jgi:hypothetical protein